ncbi:MAG: 7TM diverse intracellular signaling domain-containing protein [Crocinitomicaceae bacterium]
MNLKQVLILIFCLSPIWHFGAGRIKIQNSNIGDSFSKHVLVYEDEDRKIDISDIMLMPNDSFTKVEIENPRVQFTKSQFWMKFSITNESDEWDFILETARPITDKVFFYRVNESNEVVQELKNGDDFNYYEKDIPHRKNLFPLKIKKGETQHFFIAVISGGEGILLPLRVHEKMAFFEQDYKDQFKNGFYYGVICLVFVVYFFFFLLLKDKLFLYYILYVIFQGLLQFSLDGYSHHHFFPSNDFMVNRFPPSAGAIAIIFMLVYVSNFLKLPKKSPKLNRVFWIAGGLVGVALVFTFLPGKLHFLSYPMVNTFSLISIVLSVITIFYRKFKGQIIDFYFTSAFVVLILGAILFILGNFGVLKNTVISLNALKICSVLEVVILSIAMSYKYRELQKDKETAQAVALKNLQEKNAAMDQINIRLESQVKERTSEIEQQRSELAYKNDEIVSSIKYAQRIQEAILPAKNVISELLNESFIFYLPKDVVSGDFYFVEQKELKESNQIVFAAVDCTGHGVPGAFMSIVGNNFLTQSIAENQLVTPADILQFLNKGVSDTLKQNIQGELVRDGMDMALCMLNTERTELQFSGAKNPLYIVRKREHELPAIGQIKSENDLYSVIEIKGDKQPIGNHSGAALAPFTNYTIPLVKSDQIYVFTDGYADQFGGEKGKKFNYSRFRSLLLEIADQSMEKQQKVLAKTFSDWKGDLEQIDDVLIMGVKI